MYLKLTNEIIEKYPYSIGELRRDNPNTSFPANLSNERLAEWGVVPVQPTERPPFDPTKNVNDGTPVLQGETWVQTWVVTDASAEEIEQRTADQAQSVRGQRNALISQSDWTQLDDTPVTNAKKLEWAAYRQSLRDIPTQPGFPWDITWPTQP
jgi:hypothetical protein